MKIIKSNNTSEVMENVNKFITNRWDVFYTVDVKEYEPFCAGVLDGSVCGAIVEYLIKKHSKDNIDITITEWVIKGDTDDIKMSFFKNMSLDSLEGSRKYIILSPKVLTY